MEIAILGIDLAKYIFQLHGADRPGRAVHRSKVRRAEFFSKVSSLHPHADRYGGM